MVAWACVSPRNLSVFGFRRPPLKLVAPVIEARMLLRLALLREVHPSYIFVEFSADPNEVTFL